VTDSAPKLDRTGEPIDPDSTPWHDPRCRNGWLGYDLEHRPIPCLVCRPHLGTTLDAHDCADRLPSARVIAHRPPEECSTESEEM
jgi:hypothetical protein